MILENKIMLAVQILEQSEASIYVIKSLKDCALRVGLLEDALIEIGQDCKRCRDLAERVLRNVSQ